jgi:hypothetical protein
MTSEKDDDHIALSIPHRDGPAYPLSPSTRSPDGSVNATKQESEGERSKNITQACRIIGTFFIFFITWGVASSFSAYQAFYQQDLLADHTPSEISWIGTSQVSLLGFTGVVSGALYDRGYIRALLIVGGTMVVFGFMMLSLAKEYYQVILSQGLCIGLGEPPTPFLPPRLTTFQAMECSTFRPSQLLAKHSPPSIAPLPSVDPPLVLQLGASCFLL